MKRLRFYLDGRKIKYFACGEYGGKTGRPHYHAIIFGISLDDFQQINKNNDFYSHEAWNKGNIFVGNVTYDSAAYVARYIQKKIFDKRAYSGRELPFQIQSQGLGLSWAEKNKKILETGSLKMRGIPLSVPRYYVKKLELDLTDESLIRAAEFDEKWERYWTYKGVKTPEVKLSKYEKMIQQKEKNIEASIRIKESAL